MTRTQQIRKHSLPAISASACYRRNIATYFAIFHLPAIISLLLTNPKSKSKIFDATKFNYSTQFNSRARRPLTLACRHYLPQYQTDPILLTTMRFCLQNLIAAIIILASSSPSSSSSVVVAEAAASDENNDPLISKWPEFVSWYRSHGGIGK